MQKRYKSGEETQFYEKVYVKSRLFSTFPFRESSNKNILESEKSLKSVEIADSQLSYQALLLTFSQLVY